MATLRNFRAFGILIDSLLIILVDVSDIFIFFLLGEGEGRVRGAGRGGGGGRFLLKIPRGGGVSGGGGGRGAGRVSAVSWGIWGEGGAKYFFSGPKCPPSYRIATLAPLRG